jgi:hypothetical protein
MLALSCTVALRYYNCCADGRTSAENYGATFQKMAIFLIKWIWDRNLILFKHHRYETPHVNVLAVKCFAMTGATECVRILEFLQAREICLLHNQHSSGTLRVHSAEL